MRRFFRELLAFWRGEGTSGAVSRRIMLSPDEFERRLRTWRESDEGQEVEDLLLAVAIEERPEVDEPAPEPVGAALDVTDKRGSYMIADVEFDLERVRVEFTMPINVAQELMQHSLNVDEYEEAQEATNEFVSRLCDVMAKAMFGA